MSLDITMKIVGLPPYTFLRSVANLKDKHIDAKGTQVYT